MGIGKVGFASLVMGGAVAGSSRAVEMWLGVSQLARLADLAISMPIGLGIFYGMCRWLGVEDLDVAIRAFMAPIRRRIGRRSS
jgi:hypothetical protein